MRYKELRYAALAGNALYILWILWNAVDERGQGIGTVQLVALTGLLFLLALNIFLLSCK